MNDDRRIIESLRAGIPSRLAGAVLSSARRPLIDKIENDEGRGRIITGKYGEGKTHLLNTVAAMAEKKNMVVSLLPLSKETPFHSLAVLFRKIMESTYLPGSVQPGFAMEIDRISSESDKARDMLLFADTALETNRLYFVFKALLNSRDSDDHFLLLSDLAGDLMPMALLKDIYLRHCHEKLKMNTPFRKTQHCFDYFRFISHLFKVLGYDGWYILFDEAELIGRFGKNSRMKAYANMDLFLSEQKHFDNVYTMFAFTSSFNEEVLVGKGDYEALKLIDNSEPMKKPIRNAMNMIMNATELKSLSRNELEDLVGSIVGIYEKAFSWKCPIPSSEVFRRCVNIGFLLRTKVRAAIEILDELYLFKNVNADISATEIVQVEEPSLEDLFSDE